MYVYRLAKKNFTRLSGKGAEMFGGRWNSKGSPMIYTSESRALSMLEKYVHLPSGIMPKNLMMLSIDIPDSVSREVLDKRQLSDDWKNVYRIMYTKKTGDEFIKSNLACILKVPSAIVPGEHNFLINPNHTDFAKISIVEEVHFPLDERMF